MALAKFYTATIFSIQPEMFTEEAGLAETRREHMKIMLSGLSGRLYTDILNHEKYSESLLDQGTNDNKQ